MKTIISVITKRTSFLLLLITIMTVAAYSQAYIYTPEGQPVYVYILAELSSEQIAAYNAYGDRFVSDYGLNAVRIANSSRLYNCHDYAWSVSEGESKYWIDTPGEHGFWSDNSYSNDGEPSYIYCSELQATHAAYSEDADHSVRKIQNSYPIPVSGGRDYVSKWGSLGVYSHQKAHDPYYVGVPDYFDFKKLKTTHSGSLTNSPKTWVGAGGITHTLTDNVTVPTGVTLTVKSDVELNFNGYTLTSTGGIIVIESGVNAFTISGYVRTSGSAGIGGVIMNGLPGNPSTDANGYYCGVVPINWSGAVTPSKAGYDFIPSSSTYSNVDENQVTDYQAGIPAPSMLCYSREVNFSTGIEPHSVVMQDLNNDGKPEMIVGHYLNSNISVFMNTTAVGAATPTFSGPTNFTTGGYARCIGVGDLNKDGKPDLAVTCGVDYKIRILLNTTTDGSPVPTFSDAGTVSTAHGNYPHDVVIGDMNFDGKLDLVVSNGSSKVSVFVNNTPAGNFNTQFSFNNDFTVGSNPQSVAIGDFNSDTKMDIVTVSTGGVTISVLLNTTVTAGDYPEFASHVTFTVGSSPNSVAVGDLNSDSKPDVVVANYNSSTISVLLNQTAAGASTPAFTAKTDYPTGSNPYCVAIIDQGYKSIITTNQGSDDISVYINKTTAGSSSPTFSSRVDYPTGPHPVFVADGDINGDNKLDLSVVRGSDNVISVLLQEEMGCTSINLSPGWNFVSVPRVVTDYRSQGLFPDVLGTLFSYNSSSGNYESETILKLGVGYWIYYTSAATVNICGSTITGPLTMSVPKAGWSLLGSRTTPLPVSDLVFSNGAILYGNAFGYNPGGGYYPITNIQPGSAEWIFVNGAFFWPCKVTIP